MGKRDVVISGHARSAHGRTRLLRLVGVVMGSSSDWSTMHAAVDVLTVLGVRHEARVVSAHRMPDEMFEYAAIARERGYRRSSPEPVGAAHLPGMLAAKTTVPVLGVPVPSRHLAGEDSLLSIVQMPAGIPVATFAIGEAGAVNAALFAVALIANDDDELLPTARRRSPVTPRRGGRIGAAPAVTADRPASDDRHARRRSARSLRASSPPA